MTDNINTVNTNTEKKLTAAFCTLGCRVNQYETRAVEEAFCAEGFDVCPFEEVCDVYVINTCTVTAESDRKSRQMIRRAVKNGRDDSVVIVIGCMSQVSSEQAAKIHGVDAVVGNKDKVGCAKLAKRLALERKSDGPGEKPNALELVGDICGETEIEHMNVHGSDNTRAFLKIVDGCENNCAYCIIPKARGRVRSKSVGEVVEECAGITEKGGCREIVLTGIETAAFGRDTGSDLASLVENVSSVSNVRRIRLGSLEPTVIKDDFAERLSCIPAFMPHFHLSLQSGCDDILALMRRKYNTRMFAEKLEILRKYFADLEVTTDIIVGFPGETEDMFRKTLDYVEKCRFLYVHVFPYSDRKGTAASEFSGKLSEKEKHERAVLLTSKMLEVRKSVLEKYIGREMTLLCETEKNGVMHGYTQNYIEVRLPDCHGLCPNDEVKVKLCGISENAEYMSADLLEKAR